MLTRTKLLLVLMLNIYSFSVYAAKFDEKQLAYMPASEQIKLFKQKTISPVDVLKAQIAQYKKTNAQINATIATHFEEALRLAKLAEQRYIDGNFRPLEGITVGIKDEHYDKGWRLTQGSLIHKEDPVQTHADPIVKKLKAAGAIPTIQTTVPELYLNFTTSTKAWGTTANPWNLKYTVGGSSGGSGAALAAGYVTLATGSDMGGSIRIPAALNGLWGYKPAYGEVVTDLPLAHFSGSGPMARTFTDMVLLENVISGPSEISVNVLPYRELPTTYPDVKGMKIAYVGGMGIINPSKEVQNAMDKAIEVLKAQGAIVDRINLDLGLTPETITKYFKFLALSGSMGGAFAQYADKSENMTSYANYFIKESIEGDYGSVKLAEVEQKIKDIYKRLNEQVYSKGYVIIIAPTLPTSHIPADYDFSKDPKIVDAGIEYPALVGGLYTVPFNLLNWMPVISAPVALSAQNMPIGMQIIGKPYDIDKVFQVGYNFSIEAKEFFQDKLLPDNS